MQASYQFGLLHDPSNGPDAATHNDGIFAAGPVYGVDIDDPALAGRCIDHIGTRQTDAGPGTAAIELALTCPLPPAHATLATTNPDPATLGAMAVLAMRAGGWRVDDDARERIIALTTPTTEWQPNMDPAMSGAEALALAIASADADTSLAEHIATVQAWLLTGDFPELTAVIESASRPSDMDTLPGGYDFVHLDPRHGRDADAHNARLFAAGPVYGVGLTTTALIGRCIGNIEPERRGTGLHDAPITVALTCPLPPRGTRLAVTRQPP